jgi:hypothetical protein
MVWIEELIPAVDQGIAVASIGGKDALVGHGDASR